jgi:hypothetical protein
MLRAESNLITKRRPSKVTNHYTLYSCCLHILTLNLSPGVKMRSSILHRSSRLHNTFYAVAAVSSKISKSFCALLSPPPPPNQEPQSLLHPQMHHEASFVLPLHVAVMALTSSTSC